MRIIVTGATGFVGGAVLSGARARGLDAAGLARRHAPAPHETSPPNDITCDLLDAECVRRSLHGADVVIHAAASPGGQPPWSDGVRMFENVLAAANAAGMSRVVLVSSLSVIDYERVAPGGTIDENSPTLAADNDRDDYANAKLREEQLARQDGRGRVVIVRPGAIVGPGREWTARLGAQLVNRRWIQIGRHAPVPLVAIGSCADAILAAAVHPTPPSLLHLIDDDPPTQQQYADSLIARAVLPKATARISLAAVRAMATGLSIAPRSLRARVPSLFVRSRLAARFGAYQFDNTRMRQIGRGP